MSGFTYIIREREFRRMDEKTYKVGRTEQSDPMKRINAYPNGSELFLLHRVEDCKYVERETLKRFRSIFTHRKEYGEYFSGNVNIMIDEMKAVIDRCAKSTCESDTLIDPMTHSPMMKAAMDRDLSSVESDSELSVAPIDQMTHSPMMKAAMSRDLSSVESDSELCVACQGTRRSYLSDGVYGECLECMLDFGAGDADEETNMLQKPPQMQAVVCDSEEKVTMSFRCPLCQKVLSRAQRLETHLKKKTPCVFICNQCDKKCLTKVEFLCHQAAHRINM